MGSSLFIHIPIKSVRSKQQIGSRRVLSTATLLETDDIYLQRPSQIGVKYITIFELSTLENPK